jgi:hypothetical protein
LTERNQNSNKSQDSADRSQSRSMKDTTRREKRGEPVELEQSGHGFCWDGARQLMIRRRKTTLETEAKVL